MLIFRNICYPSDSLINFCVTLIPQSLSIFFSTKIGELEDNARNRASEILQLISISPDEDITDR